jgi:prophage regulatory protein
MPQTNSSSPAPAAKRPRKSHNPKVPTTGPPTFYRLDDVMRITRMSESTIRRRMKVGTFPKSFHLQESPIAVWDAHEVDAWCERQKPPAPTGVKRLADPI